MRKSLIISAAAAAIAAPIAFATLAIGQGNAGLAQIPGDWMTTSAIASHLEGDGWTVFKIEAELDEGLYEACVVDADGNSMELELDPLSGAVIEEEAESCLDDEDHDHDEDDDRDDDRDHENEEDEHEASDD